MTIPNCTHLRGHCWHREDGQLHDRHSGQPDGTVPVICCWCGAQRDAVTGARASAPGYADPATPHGTFVTNKAMERLVIVPCADCDALAPLVKTTDKDGKVQWVKFPGVSPNRCEKHKIARETRVA